MKKIFCLMGFTVMALIIITGCGGSAKTATGAALVEGHYAMMDWTPIYFSLRTGKVVPSALAAGTDWDLKIHGYEFFTNSGFTAGPVAPGENSIGNGGSYFSGLEGSGQFEILSINDVDPAKFAVDRGAYTRTSVLTEVTLSSINSMSTAYDIGDIYDDANGNFKYDQGEALLRDENGNGVFDPKNNYCRETDASGSLSDHAGLCDTTAGINYYSPGITMDSVTTAAAMLSDPSDDTAIYKVEGIPPKTFLTTERIYFIRCADGATYAKLMFLSHSYDKSIGKWYTKFKFKILN